MTAAGVPARGHGCPGGCGHRVPRHHFACRPCWYRLPADLRRPISATYQRDVHAHRAAMADADRGYAEQRPGVSR